MAELWGLKATLERDGAWETEVYPPNGTACWIASYYEGHWCVSVAYRDESCAGGWSNYDTWEDFDHRITHWIPIKEPAPPDGTKEPQRNVAAEGRADFLQQSGY